MNLIDVDVTTSDGEPNEKQQLIHLYLLINDPWTSGKKWTKYSRQQCLEMLYVLQNILEKRGCEFR